ncbi:hypothetical protein C2G38_2139699 [Gigaspora rosea]|uniref:Uncharacterized protein n=1 Tax=Gigaspora rosea TaxID=44941 RepID=A0A397VM45_9GLOM|nr:hypothetical protein C2G38_2139699 [Gigaspora rosea]
MSSQEYIAKSESDCLIDEYLEALDNIIPESRKSRKAENVNKEYKQYETHISGVYNRIGHKAESIINVMDSKLPESDFDDLVLDLIDDYLAEESLIKEKKEAIQTAQILEVKSYRTLKDPLKSQRLVTGAIIEPRFKNCMGIEKEASREYQVSEMKLDQKKEAIDKKDFEESKYEMLVESDDRKNEINNKYSQKYLWKNKPYAMLA